MNFVLQKFRHTFLLISYIHVYILSSCWNICYTLYTNYILQLTEIFPKTELHTWIHGYIRDYSSIIMFLVHYVYFNWFYLPNRDVYAEWKKNWSFYLFSSFLFYSAQVLRTLIWSFTLNNNYYLCSVTKIKSIKKSLRVKHHNFNAECKTSIFCFHKRFRQLKT